MRIIPGGTATTGGTSFAAPMVAGVAALAFAVRPDAKYIKGENDTLPGVVDAILDNVDPVSAWSNLVTSGGRLNALKAVEAINPAGVPAKSFIGDATTAAVADSVKIEPKPGDSTQTLISHLVNGQWTPFAYLTNAASKRIDVFTLGANDTLVVNSGVLNKIYAGGSEGNDNFNASLAASSVTLSGEAGNDTLIGGAGNDSLEGGSGNDCLVGGSGDDVLFGVNGDDTLYGGAGNDTLKGGNGADRLYGEAGNDWLYSDYETQDDTSLDSVWGGSGTDSAWVGNDPFDWVDGTVETVVRI